MATSASRSLKSRFGAARLRFSSPQEEPGQASAFVAQEYYGAQLGINFESVEQATEHYLDSGWQNGILPNPFVEPGARRSMKQAELLRTAVLALRQGQVPKDRWLRTVPSFDFTELVKSEPAALRHPGGLGGYLLNDAKALHSVEVAVGPKPPLGVTAQSKSASFTLGSVGTTMTWPAYLELLSQQIPLVRTIIDDDLFDAEFYSEQAGKTFLSTEAALADYIETGEDSGLAPNPFFEPEWYAAFERVDDDMRAPHRRFLAFVASGQLHEAGPHFDGQKLVDRSDAELTPEAGPFGHFLKHPPATTPSGTWADPRKPTQVYEAVREQARAFKADQALRNRGRQILARHVSVAPLPSGAQSTTPVLILVDGRSLRLDSVLDPFQRILAQDHAQWTCQIVLPQDVSQRIANLAQSLVDLDDRIELTWSAPDSALGAVFELLRSSSDAGVFTFWDPSQSWKPTFLTAAATALDKHPEATLAVSPGTTTQHAWLAKEDPLWLPLATSPGIVVRSGSDHEPIIATDLDSGVEWDLVLRLAPDRPAAVLQENLISLDRTQPVYARRSSRATTNELRARRLLQLEPDVVRTAGRVSILMPTYEDWWMTTRAIRSVLDHSIGHDVEIIVLDNGSRRCVSSIISSAFVGESRVTVVRTPRNCDFALGSNLALGHSSGEFVLFLNNDITVTPGWLSPLLEAVNDGASAAQPLLLYPNGTVQTAGTVFLGAVTPPVHLLAAFPPEDVHPALANYSFSALTAACLLLRAKDALALHGFDCSYVNGMEDVDLCLRLASVNGGPLKLVPGSRVIHHESQSPGRFDRSVKNRRLFVDRWHDQLAHDLDDRSVLDLTHLEVAGIRSQDSGEQGQVRTARLEVRRPHRVVEHGRASGLPCFRWAIKVPAPSGESGDTWGDTFFAADLAVSLRALGQEVVVDRGEAHGRVQSNHIDDVTLTLRGLRPFQPQPGATNLLWVISHPDLVQVDELRSGWSAVYSAGPAWADKASRLSGVPVRPLLQATNADRFTPTGLSQPSDVLFVGRTRSLFRPVVRDAIAAGAELSVYGDGWEELVDPRFIKSDSLANDQLPAAYRGARIVLNDHWTDMAAHGFLSNRLFDAAATGALIVSDSASGIQEVFGPTVRTYTDVESLRELLSPENSNWPDEAERHAAAEHIRNSHSFDVRALTLLADVLDLRGIGHDLRQ